MNKVLVSSGSRGPGLPLFLDQTEPRKAEKNFWRAPLPFPKGLDDRPPPAPLISRSGSGTVGDAELLIIYVSLSFLR